MLYIELLTAKLTSFPNFIFSNLFYFKYIKFKFNEIKQQQHGLKNNELTETACY